MTNRFESAGGNDRCIYVKVIAFNVRVPTSYTHYTKSTVEESVQHQYTHLLGKKKNRLCFRAAKVFKFGFVKNLNNLF